MAPKLVAEVHAPPRGSRARRRGPQHSPATAATARAPVLPVGGAAEGLPPLLPGVPRAREREEEGREEGEERVTWTPNM